LLRQAISRLGIHRSKKLNAIAKKKDDICKHLEAGNEVNAKIWVNISEFLIITLGRNSDQRRKPDPLF
jgi:hypothetical protein